MPVNGYAQLSYLGGRLRRFLSSKTTIGVAHSWARVYTLSMQAHHLIATAPKRYRVVVDGHVLRSTDSLASAINTATNWIDWDRDMTVIRDTEVPGFDRLITAYGLRQLRALATCCEDMPAMRDALGLDASWRTRLLAADWAGLRAGDLISTEFGGLGLIFIHRARRAS